MGRVREGSYRYIDGNLYARVRYTDDNGIRKEKLKKAKNITDAKRLIKEIIKKLDEDDLSLISRDTVTFLDLADYYEKTHMKPAQYVDGRKVEGLRSLHTHKYAIKIFREYFGKKKLRSITYGEIDRFRLARLHTKTIYGRQRSITTVNRELQVLRNMFSIAVREDWLAKNPFSSGKAMILKSHEKQRERILTLKEEEKMLSSCIGRRIHLKPILIIALDTGMRRGEILTLTFGDLDFDNRLVNIQAYHTKTEQQRTLAMTERLFKELVALYVCDSTKLEDLVFGITDNVKRSFNAVCKEAGIQGLRFHDLRHTFASRLIERGVPGEIVSKLLGHNNITTTARYINTDVNTARFAASQLNLMQPD